MPSATPTATVRNGGLDKDNTRRRAPRAESEPTLTISVKQALEDLGRDFKELTKTINENNNLAEKRFNILEQNAMLTESHAKDIEAIKKDFAGFEQRFRDHDKSTFHTQGELAIAKLQSTVEALEKAQITETAVKTLVEKMSERQESNRKWLIGQSIVIAIFVLREIFPSMLRAAQSLPTPVGGS